MKIADKEAKFVETVVLDGKEYDRYLCRVCHRPTLGAPLCLPHYMWSVGARDWKNDASLAFKEPV
jgi:hypothetical protein